MSKQNQRKLTPKPTVHKPCLLWVVQGAQSPKEWP